MFKGVKPGYKWVNTITLDEVKKKYNIDFDTLVLDCEGCIKAVDDLEKNEILHQN